MIVIPVIFLWIVRPIALITRSPKAWVATGLTCIVLSCVDIWNHETFLVFCWLFIAVLCMNVARKGTVE
jgi:hypothetical protein